MSMLNLKKDKAAPPPMPRIAAMPAPPPRHSHNEYADEAKRAAQRYLDQVEEINVLKNECDEWQRRAVLAEAEIKRLELRETNLMQQMDARNQQLLEERDGFKHTIAVLHAQFQMAGKVILDAFQSIDHMGGPRPKVNLGDLASEIERQQQVANEPMPSVVTRGPAQQHDDVPEPTKE
jgi:hypothetical protein